MSDSSAANTLKGYWRHFCVPAVFVELFFGSGGGVVVCGKRGERGGSSVLGVQAGVME